MPNWVVIANNTKLFLKKDLISIGNIRILFIISECIFKELEAAVRFVRVL